jgi:hypothetical protein
MLYFLLLMQAAAGVLDSGSGIGMYTTYDYHVM